MRAIINPGAGPVALEEARRERDEVRDQKDGAYHERDMCVALLARMARALGYRAGLAGHPREDTSWEADWRTIVFIDLPIGQVSWHVHDSELPLFVALGDYAVSWDGHTTEETYRRCDLTPLINERAESAERERDTLRAAVEVAREALGYIRETSRLNSTPFPSHTVDEARWITVFHTLAEIAGAALDHLPPAQAKKRTARK